MSERSSRRQAFAAIDPKWVLYEDDAIIALSKPAGVPSQEARVGAQDDFPARVRAFLSERIRGEAREPTYLGIHQRLDRETSGAIVYAKAREANAGLASQFEARQVSKQYVAAVQGWTGPPATTLRHRIAKGSGGVMVVRPDGKEAITHVRVRARRGDRTLLDVTIETGRTHQIRAQLAAVGSPVAGDWLYDGPAAARLMLHAAALELRHPLSGEALSLHAPVPTALTEWAQGVPAQAVEALSAMQVMQRIDDARARRYGLAIAAHREGDAQTTAFRLIHGAADDLPGVEVDVYDEWLCAHLHEEITDQAAARVTDALGSLGFAGVYSKRRPKKAQQVDDAQRAALCPPDPIVGGAAPDEFTVTELGAPYRVRLGDGLSTGLFVDQRDNRGRVRAMATGKRVLNLFAYTGPFGVAAALGGAARVWNVDASAPALDRARAGLELLGLRCGDEDDAAYRNVRSDVFGLLEAEATRRQGPRWDLIICDPPTFSSVQRGTRKRRGARRFTSGSDWVFLSALCFRALAAGGSLLATSNDRRMNAGRFRAYIRDGAREAARSLSSLRDLAPPEDFPPLPGEGHHLKGVLAITE